MTDTWEVRSTPAYNGVRTTDGWEPFAVTGDTLWLRRVVAVAERPAPRGLTQKQVAAWVARSEKP
jgi:hypothetical protein